MMQRPVALGLVLCLANLVCWHRSPNAIAAAAEEKPPAVERVGFEGKWDGKFTPTRGMPGEGKYEFSKEKDGKWDVRVSWFEGKEPKSMEIKGERLGPDALRLEGKYKDTKTNTTTRYWYIGRMEGGTLVLHYLSVNEKTEASGTGVSQLIRPMTRPK